VIIATATETSDGDGLGGQAVRGHDATQEVPGLKKNKRRRCLYCQRLFHCHPRTRAQQRYCSEPNCRAASKKASQQRWLGKPENQDYFCGLQHVNRVQAWREAHPEYGRGSLLRKGRPLQEMIKRQRLDPSRETLGLALQEPIHPQAPGAVQLNGTWAAEALQDAM
jgi:hypothetical protein